MADYKSSLPVASEVDADTRVQVKIVDATNPDTQQAVVDTNGLLGTKIHGNDPAAADHIVRTSELGNINADGFYHATDNTLPSSNGIVAFTRAASPAPTDQIKRITAISNGSVHALDMSLHDEDGAAFSDTNPLPVYVAQDPGTEVHDYNTATVASDATSNHSHAVSAATFFQLFQVIAGGSDRIKIEVQWTTDGSAFTTLFVAFSSSATPIIDITLKFPYKLTGSATSSIRVIRTNRANQSQDVYSTIVGLTTT